MLEQRGNPNMQPVDDQPPAPIDSRKGLTPVGRTLLIAFISLGVWTAVMLGLVSAGALKLGAAIVLIALAAIVLGVEVRRAQRREARRNRFGELTEHPIEPVELDSLLEIEQAGVREERRVLLAREFCRLSAEVLQINPTDSTRSPDDDRLAALRAQISLLRSSAADSTADQLPPGRPAGHLTDDDLGQAIESLAEYVDRLSRLKRITMYDPEPLRQLIRDRRNLRALQDQTIARLREPSSNE